MIAAEAGLASAVVVTALPDSAVLLPYLVVLPLLSGLARGLVGVSVVLVCQLDSVVALTLAYSRRRADSKSAPNCWPRGHSPSRGRAPRCVGVRKIGKSPAGSESDENYEAARRLLDQLRTLARRLTSGLDPVTVSSQTARAWSRRVWVRRSPPCSSGPRVAYSPHLRMRDRMLATSLIRTTPLSNECWRGAQHGLVDHDGGSV